VITLKDSERNELLKDLDKIIEAGRKIDDKVAEVENELAVEKISGAYKCKMCRKMHKIEATCRDRHRKKTYDFLYRARENLRIAEFHLNLMLDENLMIDSAVKEKAKKIKEIVQGMRDVSDMARLSEVFLADLSKFQKLMVMLETLMTGLKSELDAIHGAYSVSDSSILHSFDFSKADKTDFENNSPLSSKVVSTLSSKLGFQTTYGIIVIPTDCGYAFVNKDNGSVGLVNLKKLEIVSIPIDALERVAGKKTSI
jgi:hypothetical protein